MVRFRGFRFPSVTAIVMFFGGFFLGLFFLDFLSEGTEMILEGGAKSYIFGKLANIREYMQRNIAWSILGMVILLAVAAVIKKLLTFIVGLIIGFSVRMILFNMGYKLNFVGWVKGFIPTLKGMNFVTAVNSTVS